MEKDLKQLLLKDLCGRLPYGVKIELANSCGYHHENIAKIGNKTIDKLKGFTGKYFTIHHDNPLDWDWTNNEIEFEDFKPYLFPLSSMTEEQRMSFIEEGGVTSCAFHDCGYKIVQEFHSFKTVDWLNKNHFDYRGLIEKSLALDATNLGIYE